VPGECTVPEEEAQIEAYRSERQVVSGECTSLSYVSLASFLPFAKYCSIKEIDSQGE
jgi:hypothetical protein